jgi:DNA-directed RNA polymerase subunit RPC12/RpoP
MPETNCIECSTPLDSNNQSDQYNKCLQCHEEIVKSYTADTETTPGQEYAKQIRNKFKIFAFECSCGGTEPSCEEARGDILNIVHMNTLERIAKWLEEN